jgi:hypothetical protein
MWYGEELAGLCRVGKAPLGGKAGCEVDSNGRELGDDGEGSSDDGRKSILCSSCFGLGRCPGVGLASWHDISMPSQSE